METTIFNYQQEIKQLKKQNRILQIKLKRSQQQLVQLEETNKKNETLSKKIILDLEESRNILEQRTIEVSQTLAELKATQKQLVESEKMAALGSLVAGIAHEINTPVGTSITVASTLADETKFFLSQVEQGKLKRQALNNYIEIAQESSELILRNLHRAGELVQSFKLVAVDQTSQQKRTFSIKTYIKEILVSLTPKLKPTKHQVILEGSETVQIDSYPGVFAQIITNLVVNSLIHAYQPNESGIIKFEIIEQPETIVINYSDDGCGIPPEYISHIFEPFFTLARDRGGSGLGLHLVYNLVVQQLHGTIEVESTVGKKTLFRISLPHHTN